MNETLRMVTACARGQRNASFVRMVECEGCGDETREPFRVDGRPVYCATCRVKIEAATAAV